MIGDTLVAFMPRKQLEVIKQCLEGEEREFFSAHLDHLENVIDKMPTTYQQEYLGDQAIVHLHYFINHCDWYITEKDIDGDGTIQAFGVADLGCPEMGYISIFELVNSEYHIQLDMHWEPQTVAEVMKIKK